MASVSSLFESLIENQRRSGPALLTIQRISRAIRLLPWDLNEAISDYEDLRPGFASIEDQLVIALRAEASSSVRLALNDDSSSGQLSCALADSVAHSVASAAAARAHLYDSGRAFADSIGHGRTGLVCVAIELAITSVLVRESEVAQYARIAQSIR